MSQLHFLLIIYISAVEDNLIQFFFRDEPTVGIDPVLRLEVWKILRDLCNKGATVLITTHYMDEASRADEIGFLRKGKLIFEGYPVKIKASAQQLSLDDIFLNLCQNTKINSSEICAYQKNVTAPRKDTMPLGDQNKNSNTKRWNCFVATMIQKVLFLLRNKVVMSFQATIIILASIIFYFSIGHELYGLSVAIVIRKVQFVISKILPQAPFALQFILILT